MDDMLDLSILYVEDDDVAMELLGNYLQEMYSKVYFAKDGEEGLELFKTKDIDVVLTDIGMPKMDGLEMSRLILEIDENIPIVVISAFGDTQNLLKSVNIGIHNYLIKPLSVDKLDFILDRISNKIQDKKLIAKYKDELEQMNSSLELKVKDEIEKNAHKDALLMSQSKTAQMGELLSMIAHQWRQPINAISSSGMNLALRHSMGLLEDKDITEHTQLIERQTQYTSSIIDDFMNFFKPEKEKKKFNIKKMFESIGHIIKAQLNSKDISLELVGQDIEIFSYEKELSNVMLNLISNSRDAFKDQKEKKIVISVLKNDDQIEIIYQDNAGGIDEKIVNRIFDAYFTTKEHGKGTGIGLYMTRRIVNEVLNGDIFVSNRDDGAEFRIELINK